MNVQPVIAAIGAIDRDGIVGTGGIRIAWRDLGMTAPGTGRAFRAAFHRSDETFRRLDSVSRALVLASEAAGIDRVLPADLRDTTALVIETTVGCLDADLQFAASMGTGMCDGPVFPYTLPSTCLGEVALRHGLRGVSVCLSVSVAEQGSSLAETVRLMASGEAATAVVGMVDCLERNVAGAQSECRAVVAVLAHPRVGLAPVATWPEHGHAGFDALCAHLSRGRC